MTDANDRLRGGGAYERARTVGAESFWSRPFYLGTSSKSSWVKERRT
jgi:hypothetical protein